VVRGRSDTGELSRKITEQKCSRAEYCDERVCVFLCQRAYLQNYTPDLQEIFACVNFLFRLFLNYSAKIFTEDNTLRKYEKNRMHCSRAYTSRQRQNMMVGHIDNIDQSVATAASKRS